MSLLIPHTTDKPPTPPASPPPLTPPATPPPPLKRALPPPPHLPPVKDDDTSWPVPQAQPSPNVSWNRPIQPPPPQISNAPPHETPPPPTLFARLLARLRPAKTPKPSSNDATAVPLMTRVKSVVYKMPDPSLAFMAETFVILLLRYVYPRAVCCILARIIIPVLLFVTIGVTVVWRRTGVICADGARRFKPVPDAAMIVSKGEAMRKREFAIVNAEARLNSQQIRLENLRKEIQLRLPPQASIADMLQRENDM